MRHRFLIALLGLLLAGTAGADTINVPGEQPTIQAAIDAAAAGDQILIAAGTYTENIIVNKRLSIIGAGSGEDPLSNTIITQTPGGLVDTKVGVIQIAASGNAGDPILFQGFRVKPIAMAGFSVGRFTEATAQDISYISLIDIDVIGTNTTATTEQERGLYVDLTSSLRNLVVANCAFNNLAYGWYFQKEVSADASTVQYVAVTATEFNHNNLKGIYAEKLSDATFTGCTVDGNGYTAIDVPSYFLPFVSGIDINLKAGTYTDLQFIDCTVTNNALAGAKEGAGLTIKGRGTGNDGANYVAFPAFLDDVLVQGCLITGNERGLRLGEPGKLNTQPTDVVVVGCQLLGNVQVYGGADGSAYGDLVMQSTAPCNAVGNWWGDLNPSDQIGIAPGAGAVAYSPWLGAAPGTTPMTWYVVPGGSIQAAIDAASSGDVINIAAGTYVEQLHDVAKDLTFNGAGIGQTIVQAPVVLVPQYTTSYAHHAVFCVENADVAINDLTVDGAGRGNAYPRFLGIDLHNAGGIIDGVRITAVRDTPFSGAQHGVALYAYNQTGGPVDLDVVDCVIDDWQKNATAFSSEDGHPLHLTITGCDLTGAGATGVTAQNGFQFLGADVTVVATDNTITGVGYTGAGWVATSILNYYADITLTENTVTHGHVCIYNIDGPAVIQDNEIDVEKIGSYGYGIIASDPPNAVPSPYDSEEIGKAGRPRDKAVMNSEILDNTVVFSSPDNTGTVGIEADAGFGPNDLAVTINRNTVTGFDYGIAIGQCSGSCDTGVFTDVDARENNVAGNTSFGVWSDATYLTVDAENCWWGSPSGPGGSGPGTGAPVSPYVDFDPWRTGVIVPTPDPLDLTIAQPSGDIEVAYLGGVGNVYGYSIEVKWDNAVATATFSKPATGPFHDGSTLFQVVDIAGGKRIDAALVGDQAGIPAGPLFKMTATATPGSDGLQTVLDLNAVYVSDYQQPPNTTVPADDGLIRVDVVAPIVAGVLVTDTTIGSTDWVKNGDTVAVTATVSDGATPLAVTCDLTGFGGGGAVAPTSVVGNAYTWTFVVVGCDPADGPVTVTVTATDNLGNVATGSDSITADNILPTPLTGVVMLPGHLKIHVSWNDAAAQDANYAGVAFRYVVRGDYPQYVNPVPAYPATHLEGTAAFTATGATTDWLIAPRDIYYLAGFVYDHAGNYSLTDVSPTNRDAATNYWLGDVSPVDGEVTVFDVTALGDTYGLTEGSVPPGYTFNSHCDVGPTDDWSSFGLPMPDNTIGFFDLMVFAMNFGEVTHDGKAMTSGAAPDLTWHQIDETTWALTLNQECPGLKGLNLAAELPAGVACQVQAGDALARQGAYFLKNISQHGLDAGLAVLGQNVAIDGAGDLVVVTFSAPVANLDLEVQARDTANVELMVEMSGTTGVDLPTVFSLAQNYPNPFNPQTTITFALPRHEHVRLAVYSVDGARVRTLADESFTAGTHNVVWDGRDGGGRIVATGTYFYMIDAGDFHQVRKMVLMK